MSGYSSDGSERSKAEQVAEWIGFESSAEHALGRCRECQKVVWICLSLQPAGMADSCEEHEPLCRRQRGGCDV